jgi:hypothetical protein
MDELVLRAEPDLGGVEEMASDARPQQEAIARKPKGQRDARRGGRPVKAREAVALPILPKATNVVEVVGTEVDE